MEQEQWVGRVVAGRYRVIRHIAKGGMGSVFLAEQIALERKVALKTMRSGVGKDAERFGQRFMKEAKLCAGLMHPNTVRIYDFGQTKAGLLFLAMEYVDGRPLGPIITEEKGLEPLRAVRIARQLCLSLDEAHQAGLLHRDIKPGNVLISPKSDGTDAVKLVDFGLVKRMEGDSLLTTVGKVLGSPMYMSPEQIRGTQSLDGRSDLYALMILLYTMIEAKVPYKGGSAVKMMTAHLQAPIPPFSSTKSLPKSLRSLMRIGLAKRREDRLVSARALYDALGLVEEDLLTGEERDLRRLADGSAQIVEPTALERYRWFIVGALLCVAMCVVLLGVLAGGWLVTVMG